MIPTHYMRNVLIQHMDFKHVPINIKHPRWITVKALLDRKWLRVTDQGHATVITEEGRKELCWLLSDYAEAMIAAGFEEGITIKERLSAPSRASIKTSG